MTERRLPTLVVAAAVIETGDGYLLTRRLNGTHLEGFWEFPGGKREADESLDECLRRELLEELGVHSTVGNEILTVTHHYPELSVELHFLACTLSEFPRPVLGQEMRWVPRQELSSLMFPPADEQLIRLLATR